MANRDRLRATSPESATWRLRRTAVLVVLLALAIASAAGVAGWRLSRPVPVRVGPPPGELDAEPIAFASESGSVIHGWFSRTGTDRGAVLLLPGVRSNRLAMVRRAEFLRAAGYSTLLIDFQATGESQGDLITFGWRERYDVLAAVRALHDRLPGEPIGIVGISLGGAATLLAIPPLDVQAVVLEAVYPSIDVAVKNRLEMRLGPLGSMLAPLLLLQLQTRVGASPSDLRPIDHISQLRCPLLVIGGMADRHTTVGDTRALYEAAREPKQLWLVPGADHVDLLDLMGDRYRERVRAFLGAALTGSPAQRITRHERVAGG